MEPTRFPPLQINPGRFRRRAPRGPPPRSAKPLRVRRALRSEAAHGLRWLKLQTYWYTNGISWGEVSSDNQVELIGSEYLF